MFFKFLSKCLIILVIGVFSIQYWLQRKSYIFDEQAVSTIALKYVGKTDPFPGIAKEFRKKYPGHILPDKDLQWVFINAGGWMGSMCLIHASLTEYVLFFGTAIDTSGHSGRYWANISDTILSGSFVQWKEGDVHNTVYKPGDTVQHAWGEAAGISWTAGTWMVEYGRGFIPSTLGFALSDTVFGTQDFLTMFYVFKVYAKALLQDATFVWVDLKNYLKESL